jgi:hypothetical protein
LGWLGLSATIGHHPEEFQALAVISVSKICVPLIAPVRQACRPLTAHLRDSPVLVTRLAATRGSSSTTNTRPSDEGINGAVEMERIAGTIRAVVGETPTR